MTQISPQNILRHELIGLDVKVARSRNPDLRGAKGTVVDESRNMLTLASKGKMLKVPKNVATFRFKLENGTIVDVDGVRLVARPENRLKTKVRRW
jgi:ribonuclease P protein subunit POP4